MEMATSTCAKCGGHSFERALLTPIGEERKLAIIQCANCGTVIGALDPASSTLIEGLQKQIAAIDAGLVRIAKTLAE
jgi:transcription elongation factor Elf1